MSNNEPLNIKPTLEIGDSMLTFLQKLVRDENIPKDIKERSQYIYIYIRDYIVDQVCFVSRKENTFKRFVKGTSLTVENCRIWVKPTKKYTVLLGNAKLEDGKIYIIQFNHTNECKVFNCYYPPITPSTEQPVEQPVEPICKESS